MKTNASPKTIVQAVDIVSKRNYEGNVVLRRTPEKMTKNVNRFTLKTMVADKPGSLTTKQGIKQTKANWQVHQDVMYEILRIDPRPHIYVDTIYGREYNKNPHPVEIATEHEEETTRKRRTKKNSRKQPSPQSFVAPAVQSQPISNTDNVQRQNILNLVQAIKYIMQNPSVLMEA
jgi:hypothetical protein